MTIGVVDDEAQIREYIAERVRSSFPEALIRRYSSGEELLSGREEAFA